ncbi:hypothetical protein KQI63_02565 [bacterium]|nr:hypothetical protein [bacterium]
MDRSKIKPLIIVLIVGYLVFFAANYFFLKATVEWPEEGMTDSTQAMVEEEEGLNLTWDISGRAGPQSAKTEEEIEAAKRAEIREETASIVDSALVAETTPLNQELQGTKAELTTTRDQVNELERLIAVLATQADSLDQANAARLSKIVEQMKPADAAAIMNRLGDKANAELLLKMKQRQAARILAAMPRERAAEVAKYLSRAYARSSI